MLERAFFSLAKFNVYSLLLCILYRGLLYSLFYLASMSHESLYSRQNTTLFVAYLFLRL